MTFVGVRQTGIPGIDAIRETLEKEFTWGSWEYNKNFIIQRQIDGAGRDTGNTGDTTVWRPGIAMQTAHAGITTPEKMVRPWLVGDSLNYTFCGFLLHTVNTQVDGADTNQFRAWILAGGNVKASAVALSVETSYGLDGAADDVAFRALATAANFIFDDFDIHADL